MHAYPLKLHFRLLTLAPRINAWNAKGEEILYVEQKTFALKEAVNIFNNSKDKKLLYTIKADQIIDFGAQYFFHTAQNQDLGSIQQDGVRSLFQASYSLFDKKGKPLYKITQSNPWTTLLDSLIEMIPFIDLITGFILNPSYTIAEKEHATPIMIMKKKPSLLESEFEIKLHKKDISDDQELLCLLAFIMIVQLERNRG